jgi:1,2-diacylglycerol 3-alpha-glucosyltransferase
VRFSYLRGMDKKITYEVCAFSLESCRNAEQCGADRVELCASMDEGGVTPAVATMNMARGILKNAELYVMVRPRGGDFCYSDDEFEQMSLSVDVAKHIGADGVVLGILLPDGSIDVERTAQLVREAAPMKVTFHRAFDRSNGLADFNAGRHIKALEDVISTGCSRVLTSGFRKNAELGIPQLEALVSQSAGRIEIMAGCGVNAKNAAKILSSGADALHFTAKALRSGQMTYFNDDFAGDSEKQIWFADPKEIMAIRGAEMPHGLKILLVIDQFDDANNGTTISARRFAERLMMHGNEVRVAAAGKESEGKYSMRVLQLPGIANKIVSSQGMEFALPDKEALTEAIIWADVVHFMMPFMLGREGLKICEEHNVPHTGAFHVQPENITATLGLENSKLVNDALYAEFRDQFYNRFTHIHCPSNFIATQLREHGYTAKLHVISNGIEDVFHYIKTPKEKQFEGKFIIEMTGRYSYEKRQDVLIEAIAKCRHEKQIQLVLAGQGPLRERLERLGSKLTNKPLMKFFTTGELISILAQTDLYCHSADVEIEAISCIEAVACGIVPIIADSPKSATPQFALDDRSLFPAGDSDALAAKIDWWIDHSDERHAMELKYAEFGKTYRIDECVKKAEAMFHEAIAEAQR